MFERVRERVRREYSHFDNLGDDLKRLLFSYGLLLMAWPMIVTFVNAYLWQYGEGPNRLIFYNLMFFLGLPVGFWLNTLFLEKVHVLKLYAAGAVVQGISAFLVILYPAINIPTLSLYGLFFGVGSGLYWANKNYLTLRLSRGRNRMYYNNIEYSMDLLVYTIVPVVVGWLLVLGEVWGIYVKESAYKYMLFVAQILLMLSGYIIQRVKIADFRVKRVLLRDNNPEWNWVRLYNVGSNVLTGLHFFLPGVLVLYLVGEEGIFGTVESVACLLSAIVMYVVGRKVNLDRSWKMVAIGSLVVFAGTLTLSFWYGVVGVLANLVLMTIGRSLIWTSSYSQTMELMDQGKGAEMPERQYAYVFDNELFFNVGRVMGVGILLYMIYVGGINFALRYIFLLAAALQVFMIWPQYMISKHLRK